MIQIPSRELPPPVRRTLRKYQSEIDSEPDFGKRVEIASARFRLRNRDTNAAFSQVRRTLTLMCSGAKRCMYCEDSAADEVEHHRPKNLYPEHVFDWENYLYACGPCNGPKNSRFAVFEPNGSIVDVTRKRGEPARPPVVGHPVLLHPRIENPLEFMMLDILGDTFLFVPTAVAPSQEFERASYTIQLLRLNQRDHLPVARREAYGGYTSRLLEYVPKRDAGAGITALGRMIDAIGRMQHPTVWSEMRRQRSLIPELTRLFGLAPEALTW
jgi:5-methylcytosine-specific restriction endonuclease McrA